MEASNDDEKSVSVLVTAARYDQDIKREGGVRLLSFSLPFFRYKERVRLKTKGGRRDLFERMLRNSVDIFSSSLSHSRRGSRLYYIASTMTVEKGFERW